VDSNFSPHVHQIALQICHQIFILKDDDVILFPAFLIFSGCTFVHRFIIPAAATFHGSQNLVLFMFAKMANSAETTTRRPKTSRRRLSDSRIHWLGSSFSRRILPGDLDGGTRFQACKKKRAFKAEIGYLGLTAIIKLLVNRRVSNNYYFILPSNSHRCVCPSPNSPGCANAS
jgi:hypothetical protein